MTSESSASVGRKGQKRKQEEIETISILHRTREEKKENRRRFAAVTPQDRFSLTVRDTEQAMCLKKTMAVVPLVKNPVISFMFIFSCSSQTLTLNVRDI